jgi:3-hydroxyisobutyrate dehydrogenase
MVTPARIGFIGLGAMGAPMATRLLTAGYDVHVFDTRASQVELLASRGATAASSVIEVARRSDTVLTSLPSPEAVREVVLDETAGVIAGLAQGAMLIEHSTVSVALSKEIADECGRHGIAALDAPISTASGPAEEGALTIMVGGSLEAFATAQPVLKTLGQHIAYLGGAGMGTATKLATQYMGLCNAVAAVEGALLAEAAGVDMKKFADAVPGTIGNSMMLGPSMEWVRTRTGAEPDKPRGVVAIFEKDIRLGVEEAKRVGSPHAIGSLVAALYADAVARGWGERRFLSPVRLLTRDRRRSEGVSGQRK